VEVVACAADCMRDSIHVSDDTADVFMHASPCGGGQPGFAVLRAEHEMIMQREVGRGHAAASRAPVGAQPSAARGGVAQRSGGSRSPSLASPPANFSGPSGTSAGLALPSMSAHHPPERRAAPFLRAWGSSEQNGQSNCKSML
jgi:hypothetical protein